MLLSPMNIYKKKRKICARKDKAIISKMQPFDKKNLLFVV
jgi:hypothetical protein